MSGSINLATATKTVETVSPTFASETWFASSDEGHAQQVYIETMIRAGIPPILWGPPGSGKTQTVFAIAQKLGYKVQVVIGSRKEPTFLEGIPIVVRPSDEKIKEITEDENLTEHQRLAALRARTVNALPDWFEFAMANPKTIIFWDEIGSIGEDVQASMLSVVEEREIDGVRLPDEVRFVAAGNDIDQAANGQYLSPPFANRFAHHKFSLPNADWVDGFRTNFGKPLPNTKGLPAEEVATLNNNFKAELARLSGYLFTNMTAISPVVDSNPEKSGKAWASRRTWTKLAQALAYTDAEDRVVRDMTIASIIGLDQGAAFKTWDSALNFPSADELLRMAKDEKHDWGQYGTDKVYAMLAYVLNYMTVKNFEDIVNFFVKVADKHQAAGFVMSGVLASKIIPMFGVKENELPQSVYVQLGLLSKSYKRTQSAAGAR
jgi:MoxR-like ATPase